MYSDFFLWITFTMASIVSYNNDKAVVGEVEYPASDPASGAFFQPDFKK